MTSPRSALPRGGFRRCERLVPPFRSHGRLAQLPENRGGSVGGNEAAFVSLSSDFTFQSWTILDLSQR